MRVGNPDLGIYLQPDPIHRSSAAAFAGPQAYAYAAGRPLVNVDPDGRLVAGVYDVKEEILSLVDADTGQSAVGHFKSGNVPGQVIPRGTWDILGHPDPNYYRLEAQDSPYGDDFHNATQRNLFRLHHLGSGGNQGCIAAQDGSVWQRAKALLDATSKGSKEVQRNLESPLAGTFPTESVTYYGEIDVVDSCQ